MTALGRRRGRTPQSGAGIERGDEASGRTRALRPLAKSGLGLGRSGQGLGVGAVPGEPGRAVGCILSRSWSLAFRRLRCVVHRSRSGSPVRPTATAGNWSLDPARRTLRSEDRPVTSGRRAGPVRLISGVSPGFPRRRVPWPVDVPTKPAMRQAPELAPMCTTGPAAVDKPVNVCGRIEFASADQRFALSPETDASGSAPRAQTGGELRGPQAGGRTTSLVYPPGAIRHTVFDTSSAISRMRLAGSKATPTGRPRALPSFRKPVAKSTGCPDGRPLANGMKTTL